MKIKNVVNFIFEINHLKKQARSGFQFAGIKYPDTVAEHMLRSAQIGYILAVMEGNKNPEKIACMLMIHDNAETRIGDQHKITARYISKKEAEGEVFEDQIRLLDEKIQNKWKIYFDEYESRNTQEGVIAKDADWLEMAFQAKEYFDMGITVATDWIDNVEKAVETKSAKKIMKEMRETQFTDWWKDLKKMTYEKLQ